MSDNNFLFMKYQSYVYPNQTYLKIRTYEIHILSCPFKLEKKKLK